MRINMTEWKEFSVEQLFFVKRGKTLSLENKSVYVGDIPCINGSSENNGVFCYLSENITEMGFELHKAPALSLARVGNAGKTFVQNSDFFIADNAFSLTLKEKQEIPVYLFISTVLDLETIKYSYGRTISIEKYKNLVIKLPALENGKPDYHFMKNYIDGLQSRPIQTSVSTGAAELAVNNWRSYSMGSLFDFAKGKRLVKADMVSGDVNYLGAISENNGVREKIETDHFQRPNCITVNYNGSVGEAFYQSEAFWASDDVNILYAKDFWKMNKYIAMFLITLIKANRYRFGYGRKWTLEKMKETNIKLPSQTDGMPDFIYMENYIKSLPYSDRI